MNGRIAIRVDDVRKKLGRNQALDGVSLRIQPGRMHGVIGPEGAGKTTLMRTILGLLTPDSGSVAIEEDGKPLSLTHVRERVAYMPQQQSLYPDLSIAEHLDFFRALYHIDQNEYAQRRSELLSITRLEPFVDRAAGKLSGGMYKKLGLMCALLRAPDVMLLDEPTNGVDPISRREFWDLLYRLADQKILIVVATAYMDEAERCSTVHLIESGKAVASGEPRSLLEREGVRSFDELFLRHAEVAHD
jgi:ABC-2 type transport system ATP-binding protein